MIRRPRRVIPASIVAGLLLVAMVVVVWSCVQVLLGQAPLLPLTSLAARGSELHWNDLAVLIGGGILAGLGLVLLACAWLPGAPNVLSLADVGDQTQAGATTRTVRQAVAAAASRVVGVSAATAQVRAAVGERLTAIALRRPPTITVRVNRTRSS